jgi:hypothetical protein
MGAPGWDCACATRAGSRPEMINWSQARGRFTEQQGVFQPTNAAVAATNSQISVDREDGSFTCSGAAAGLCVCRARVSVSSPVV